MMRFVCLFCRMKASVTTSGTERERHFLPVVSDLPKELVLPISGNLLSLYIPQHGGIHMYPFVKIWYPVAGMRRTDMYSAPGF